MQKFLEFIDGYKTYIGLVLIALGSIGIALYFTSEQVATVLDNALKIAGLILSFIGAIHKDIKIEEAESGY